MLSGLDIRAIANDTGSPILAYVADRLVKGARDGRDAIAGRVDTRTDGAKD